MTKLTVIPGPHRRIYLDALYVGLNEAGRRGMTRDALPFAEFHRALYRPMVDLITAEARQAAISDGVNALRRVLVEHGETTQRFDEENNTSIAVCICGHERAADNWAAATAALDEHIAEVWRIAMTYPKTSTPIGDQA